MMTLFVVFDNAQCQASPLFPIRNVKAATRWFADFISHSKYDKFEYDLYDVGEMDDSDPERLPVYTTRPARHVANGSTVVLPPTKDVDDE